jgi:hypothetical protein
MWGNTVAIHIVFFKKKTTKLNFQQAPYKKNKINKNNSEKKNTKKEEEDNFGKEKAKKNEKKTCGES